MNDAQRFLICRTSAIGDCILTLPLLCALRDQFPRAYIAWVAERGSAPLLKGHGSLDQLIVVPKGWLKSPGEIWRLRRQLRELKFDVAIDPQSLAKSALVAWLSGAPTRIGFGGRRGREMSTWLNTQHVLPTAPHLVAAQLQLLAPLGVAEPRVRFDVPREESAENAMRVALDTLHLGCPFAVLNVGAGWNSRLWPTRNYGRVARYLGQRYRLPSLVVWAGDREQAWAQDVVAQSSGHALLAPPTGLPELAALLRRTRMYIGSDTGPMHLAAAVGTPCIGLFGTTRPEDSGPYGQQHICLQARYQSGTARQRRRAGNEAMREITAESVCTACDSLLSQSPTRYRFPDAA